MKNWLKQQFCRHDWEPTVILHKDVYNHLGLRYAKCHCVCEKCGKKAIKDILLHGKYQHLQ